MFYLDPLYLLIFLGTMLISVAAQAFVSSAYRKWSQVRNGSNMTGLQVGQELLRDTGLGITYETAFHTSVQFQGVGGNLTDHYDPRSHTVRLSQTVATQPSVASMAVVAHELGHAQQHAQKSPWIAARNFLVPAVRLSPMISYFLIVMGLVFGITGLFDLGIIFFGITVLFALITLPVEFDASKRGLRLLNEAGLMVTPADKQGSQRVLTAAASTYVAAAVTAVVQLLYYMSLGRRR